MKCCCTFCDFEHAAPTSWHALFYLLLGCSVLFFYGAFHILDILSLDILWQSKLQPFPATTVHTSYCFFTCHLLINLCGSYFVSLVSFGIQQAHAKCWTKLNWEGDLYEGGNLCLKYVIWKVIYPTAVKADLISKGHKRCLTLGCHRNTRDKDLNPTIWLFLKMKIPRKNVLLVFIADA